MMVRLIQKNGIEIVREASYWYKPEDATPWQGQHIATRCADGIWRLYSAAKDTCDWTPASVIEQAAFNALPAVETGN